MNTAPTNAEETGDETRDLLHERIAELLAELSDAVDTPPGMSVCAPFGTADVTFASNSWMERLADVQGWLALNDDLTISNPSDFVTTLVTSLEFADPQSEIIQEQGVQVLSLPALERLRERSEIAARLQQDFMAVLDSDGGSLESATKAWQDAWASEEDSSIDEVATDPVKAEADVWPVSDLSGTDLNLNPSYQRGDVWGTSERQALIESVIRGIPLPSIILLRTGPDTPHEVVDGKQRLTALLRFVGQHPVALDRIREAEAQHPEAQFAKLFAQDYPKFRRAWKRYMGEPLTAKLEDDYYFPFKLRNDAKGGLVGPELESLRGKYYTEIKSSIVNVAGQKVTVSNLFEKRPKYRVPVIVYDESTTQRQIHEVFKLYNKQGMHLNAEEIRNAVYHDIELTRAILVAAGDVNRHTEIAEVAPSLERVQAIHELGKTLKDYGFGEARYRRTKVLGWIVAVLVGNSHGKLLPSTARYTDQLLEQVQKNKLHPLRDPSRIADLFTLIAQAVDLHASHDELWPEQFRGDGKKGKWQDLQLVGSVLGITVALAGAPQELEDQLMEKAELIRKKAVNNWLRPEKAQTRNQWDYIGRVCLGIVETLGVDVTEASNKIEERFGNSGIGSLQRSIDAEQMK